MRLWKLGLRGLIAGGSVASKPVFAEALGIAQNIDDRVAQYALLDALAYLAAGSGQPRLAAQLLGAAETVRTGAGATVIAFLAPLLAQAEASPIAALGASRFDSDLQTRSRLNPRTPLGPALGRPPPGRHP